MKRSARAAALGCAAAVVLGGGAAARATGSGSVPRPLELRVVGADSAPRAVEVRGVGQAALRRLAGIEPDDRAWSAALSLRVEGNSVAGVDAMPPVLSRYEVAGGHIRLTPRFPLTPGVAYRVRLDPAALARLAGGNGGEEGEAHERRFVVPARTVARTTRVLGLYPSVARVPANLLRWYVELSAPMEVGGALEHVRLLDASGREVAGAFLRLDEELWDPERRRLTILFDPGRVKRGIRTNLESGAPLVDGRRYRLVVDGEWRDGRGAGLASGYEMQFEVGGADRRSPDPRRWRITPPTAGSREPLRVAFGESLDHALVARTIAVVDGEGKPLAGRGVPAEGDSLWSFVPRLPWDGGEHRLSVHPSLEDLAGNSLARPFDADTRGGDPPVERAADAARERWEVPFVVRGRKAVAGEAGGL